MNAKAFLEQIRKLVLANNVDRAVKLCSATEAPVAQVAKAGLQRVHRGEIAIAQAIEETLVDVTPLLKKRVQILWSLANIADPHRSARYGPRPHHAPSAPSSAAKPEEQIRPARRRYLRGAQQHRHGSRHRRHLHHRPRLLSSASKKQVGDLEGFSLKLENLLAESSRAPRPSRQSAAQDPTALDRKADRP